MFCPFMLVFVDYCIIVLYTCDSGSIHCDSKSSFVRKVCLFQWRFDLKIFFFHQYLDVSSVVIHFLALWDIHFYQTRFSICWLFKMYLSPHAFVLNIFSSKMHYFFRLEYQFECSWVSSRQMIKFEDGDQWQVMQPRQTSFILWMKMYAFSCVQAHSSTDFICPEIIGFVFELTLVYFILHISTLISNKCRISVAVVASPISWYNIRSAVNSFAK